MPIKMTLKIKKEIERRDKRQTVIQKKIEKTLNSKLGKLLLKKSVNSKNYKVSLVAYLSLRATDAIEDLEGK